MYEESSINLIKYVVIGFLVVGIFLALIFLPLSLGQAQSSNNSSVTKPALFSDTLAANTLCSAGLEECSQTGTVQPSSGGLFSGIFGGSSAQADPIISVVNVPGQTAVYRIINGQKHSIPTTEIFENYGFSLEIVQPITQQELDKYPLARLFVVKGQSQEEENPTVYYLTEGGMIRPMLNDKVFYSYGDRKEDVITISQKEFNYYPRNEFVYLERPKINRDIYQITGGIKRYLTPVAVKRMDLKESEIAPINQIEFDEYPAGEPVIF